MKPHHRRVLLCLSASLLAGCSTAAWYQGLQTGEARRQANTPGAPQRTMPTVSHQEYEKERSRINGAETR